jgi:hypothetical protein
MGFEIIVVPQPWGRAPCSRRNRLLCNFPALPRYVPAFESSMPPERIVLDFDERVSWFENGSPR